MEKLEAQICRCIKKGLKGVGNGKIDIFKELTPHSWTYDLRGQGEKKSIQNQDKQTLHTVLQKLSPKPTRTPFRTLANEIDDINRELF